MDKSNIRKKAGRVAQLRFGEGSGERYMADGITVRCQAVSRAYLKRIREECGNPDLSSSDVWPNGQCHRPAEPGAFLCKFHGGHSPAIYRRAVIQYMPIDLARIVDALLEDPDYLSRRLEICLLQGRITQLYRELSEGGRPNRSVIAEINSAVEMIQNGSVEEGISVIRSALERRASEGEIWKEIMALIDLLQSVTRTEVRSLYTLRAMASAEQVMALVEGIASVFIGLVKRYVAPNDYRLAERLSNGFIHELRLLTNARLGPKTISILEQEAAAQGVGVQDEEAQVIYGDNPGYS